MIDNCKVIATVPKGEKVIGMQQYNGKMILVLSCGAYYINASWEAVPIKFREATPTEQDISKCPVCGGYADNGFDRCLPPNPYYCTKCQAAHDKETKL